MTKINNPINCRDCGHYRARAKERCAVFSESEPPECGHFLTKTELFVLDHAEEFVEELAKVCNYANISVNNGFVVAKNGLDLLKKLRKVSQLPPAKRYRWVNEAIEVYQNKEWVRVGDYYDQGDRYYNDDHWVYRTCLIGDGTAGKRETEKEVRKTLLAVLKSENVITKSATEAPWPK